MYATAFRRSFLPVAMAIGALTAAQPVLADTELDAGTVGVHSLTDTASNPGALCKYRYLPTYDVGRLKRIVVRPPNMRAVAGRSAQEVGWQFTIQRRIDIEPNPGTWEDRYTSPEMTAVTDDSHNASFGSGSVSVTVPFGPGGDGAAALYRVVVKMIWHRPNGSVQGTARDRVDFYERAVSNGGGDVQNNFCTGYWFP
jgi:hypothetical protein